MVRLWLSPETELPPLEHCGEKGAVERWEYLSQGSQAKISFISADKTIGATVNELNYLSGGNTLK